MTGTTSGKRSSLGAKAKVGPEKPRNEQHGRLARGMHPTLGAPDLPPCPHCGADHGETQLRCPEVGEPLPLEGRLLDSKFRLVAKLGQGGMGSVWRAENVLVHRTVAIKLLHAEYAHNLTTLGRFRQEATAAGRIRNPHICDILDLGQSELGPYIVMELMRGRSLAQLLDDNGRVDPGLAVLVVRQALDGLAAAHAAGIIHRDLKPENIFLHEPTPGRLLVKLVDFGISKFTEGGTLGRTRQGVLMGTPEYMSPEQAEGAANVDARTDVWAMGAVLYRALSGSEAFLGPTLAATLTNVTLNDPPPIRTVAPGIPEGLAKVVDACLVKDRDQRVSTALRLGELLRPFEQAPSGEVISQAVAADRAIDDQDLAVAVAATDGANRAPSVAPSRAGSAPAATSPRPPAAPVAAETWNSELSDASPGHSGAPVTPADSWTLSGADFDGGRPESSLQDGGSGRILLWIVLVALLGGGAWIGYRTWSVWGAGPDEGDDGRETPSPNVVAVPSRRDLGSSRVKPDLGAPDSSRVDADSPPEETTGGREGGEATPPGPRPDTPPDPRPDPPPNPKPDPKAGGPRPRPDLSRLHKVGRLYAPRGEVPRLKHSAAAAHCKTLKKTKFGRLTRWRLPSGAELRKFQPVVGALRYWTRDRAGNQAKSVNLNGGSELWSGVNSKLRALCVSTGR